LPQSDVTIANPLRDGDVPLHPPRSSRKYRPEITFLSEAEFSTLEFQIAADLAARTSSSIADYPRNETGGGVERTRRRDSGERLHSAGLESEN